MADVESKEAPPPDAEAAQQAPAAVPKAPTCAHAFGEKLRGVGAHLIPPRRQINEALVDGVFAFLGIALLAGLHEVAQRRGLSEIVASFGATAVLVFAAPASPLAQPRNVVGGHLLSAVLGVCVAKAFAGTLRWLACGISVGLAVAAMGFTGTTHPPAGATALVAVLSGESWLFIAMPVGTGACILVVCSILFNNLHRGRRYPLYW